MNDINTTDIKEQGATVTTIFVEPKEQEKKVEKKKKAATRVNLRDFPDAVIAFLMMDDSGPRSAANIAMAMQAFDKRYAKASMSGMENRIRKMEKDGDLVMVPDADHPGGIQRFALPAKYQPEVEPELMPPFESSLFAVEIYDDHVRMSIPDFNRLMKGLEHSNGGK